MSHVFNQFIDNAVFTTRKATMAHPLDQLAARCYNTSADHGFWELGTVTVLDENDKCVERIIPRNKGEMIALIHSELSEALEAVRKPGMDQHCPEHFAEAVEMADALIRILDYCAGHGLALGAAFEAKMKFNEGRPYKHGKKF